MADYNDILVRFRADTSNFAQGTETIMAQLLAVQKQLGQMGASQIGLDLTKARRELEQTDARVDTLGKRMEALLAIQARFRAGAATTQTLPEEQAQGLPKRISRTALESELVATSEQMAALQARRIKDEETAVALLRHYKLVNDEILKTSIQRQFVEEKTAAILTGARGREIIQRESQVIQDQIDKLIQRRALLESQSAQAIGGQAGGRLEQDTARSRQLLAKLADQILKTDRQIFAINEQLANSQELSARRRARLEADLAGAEQKRMSLLSAQVAAQDQATRARTGAESRQAAVVDVAGARSAIQQIDAELARLRARQRDIWTSGLETISPRLQRIGDLLRRNEQVVQRTVKHDEQRLRLLQKYEQTARAITDKPPVEVIDLEGQIGQLGRLERAMFTAFDNVGNRFRTAFQFAVSGAILYGAQRLAREFIQAAIEVERTFVDIESALEFDLADQGIERGTTAFDQQLEGIRRTVLETADEFNVLPTEANAAAYKMVARFQDMDNAVATLRAQFLATKISTIDQSEALRALTATAEGFASAVLSSNDSLTFQERLLERETVAAENYGKALDIAVTLQQRFGVDVEDTLEGSARAAETFSQLGFSIEETASIIASASFTLGQTGVNVAERFNRAFGTILSPDIRNQLLDLAAASEAFTLTLDDFDTGATAIQAIDRQIRNLEQLEPNTAIRIRDILGQRRETEVVAAFLGTSDMRRAMEAALGGAAGAAEQRFGFLATTISERVQSIISQFQELAQNFERLELFGPIKLALVGIDGLLSAMNGVLLKAIEITQIIDSWGESINLKAGTALKNIVVTLVSIIGLIKLATAAFTVLGVTRAAGVGARAAATQVLDTAGITSTFLVLSNTIRNTTGFFARLGVQAAILGRAFRLIPAIVVGGLARFLNQLPFVRNMGATGSALSLAVSKITVAIGLAIAAINLFADANKTVSNAILAGETRPARVEQAVRQQALVQPFETKEAEELFRLEQELNQLRQDQAEETLGFWQRLAVGTFPIFNADLREEFGIGRTLAATFGPDQLEDAEIPGTQEYWEEQIANANKAFGESILKAFASDIPLASPGTAEHEAANQANVLWVRLMEAVAPDDIQAVLEEIKAWQLSVETLSSAWNQAVDAFEISVEAIRRDTNDLQREITKGLVSPTARVDRERDLAARANKAAKALEANAKKDGTVTPEELKEIDEAFQFAMEAEERVIEAVRATFRSQRNQISLIQDPATRMQAEADLLIQEVTALMADEELALGWDNEEIQELLFERQKVLAEAARLAKTDAIEIAQTAVDTATTVAAWEKAQRELLEAIRRSAESLFKPAGPAPRGTNPFFWEINAGGFQTPAAEIRRVADEQRSARQQADRDRARQVEINTRLKGPIRSRILAIQAEINGLQFLMKTNLPLVEAMEARLRLAELTADLAEAELERVAAFTRLQAGVNDSIKGLQAEISIAARQLQLTARLFGSTSAEYFQLQLAIANFQQQLVQAQLELEGINRRLGSDITNSFEQAQLDLIDIMRTLSQVDLGPLEKARAELEKKQAEAAAQRAFFDDRLFQLRFAFETGDIGLESYISSLKRLLETVDTSTQQGKEIFLQIQDLIDSLANDVGEMQFNVPTSIRLPTLFEIRRALAADQLGVNYMDNRVQTIDVHVTSAMELEQVFQMLDRSFGDATNTIDRRTASGGAGVLGWL